MQVIPIKLITQTVDLNVSSTKNSSDIRGNVHLTDDISLRGEFQAQIIRKRKNNKPVPGSNFKVQIWKSRKFLAASVC